MSVSSSSPKCYPAMQAGRIYAAVLVFRGRPDTSGRNDIRSSALQSWSTLADVIIAIRAQRRNRHGSAWPAASTIHRAVAAELARSGLLGRVAPCLTFSRWFRQQNRIRFGASIFKRSFECGNGERCFTVTDAFSRFVLHCQVIDNLGHEEVDRICDALARADWFDSQCHRTHSKSTSASCVSES